MNFVEIWLNDLVSERVNTKRPMENKKQRRLAAIMFTDIVGYSRIMQTDEEKGYALRKRHRKIFSEITEKYDGELLQYFGDGTLSIFPSAAAAVECAVEMQKDFQKEPRVPLRIGIHTGDITFTEDDVYGHGMNIAARIEPMCIPGGIYISGKVNEDIVNHRWLKAQSLGHFELKNINDAIEVFAITNEGINAPEFEIIQEEDSEYITPPEQPTIVKKTGFKKRKRAALLALLLGVFGVHRFYLGQRNLGMAHFFSAIIGIISGVWFLIAIPAIIGFIDSVTLFSMAGPEFEEKYNSIVTKTKQKEKPILSPSTKPKPFKEEFLSEIPEIDKAHKALKIGDAEQAIKLFSNLLSEEPENKDLHFSLAQSHSINQDTKKGFYHLSKAVEFGYKDFKRIQNHYTLAFLRSRKDFKKFEQNGYRLVKMLPSPQEDLLDSERPLLLKKLEKIEELGELLHRGEISEEEFTAHKKSLLDD